MREASRRRVGRISRLVGLASLAAVCAAVALPSAALASSSECPNEALRAESNVNPATGRPYSTELPDCRAYELLTSEKNDNNPVTHPGVQLQAFVGGDGNSLLWGDVGTGPYAQPSNGTDDALRVQRGAGGWSPPRPLAPENNDGSEAFKSSAASGDLSTVLLEGQPLPSELLEVGGVAVSNAKNLLESGPGGCCTTVVSGISGASSGDIKARVSTDGSHVFFDTQAQLLPEDKHVPILLATGVPETSQVYEWTRAGGLRLAGVDSEGHATSPCGAALANYQGLSSHDVSADGSRVFFESPDPTLGGTPPEECNRGPVVNGHIHMYVSDLYVRENGSTTVDVSKPPAGVADWGASFVGASTDGSKVFFLSGSQLTPDKAMSGPGHVDLYEYDVDTGVLRRLSVGPPGHDDAQLASAIVSADGSHAYFTALGQLVPGAGEPGQENLYMYTAGRVSFIATVGAAYYAGTNAEYFPGGNASPLDSLVAAVSPDGSDLVFNSIRSLTAYDSAGHGELYRYDAPSSTLSCVSCSPTGAPAEGVVYLHASQPFLDGAAAYDTPAEQVGGVSSDGSTVFFDATGQLLPAAVNTAETERKFRESGDAHEPIGDVYEWRDGVLSLISTGTSAASDRLIGSSPSGSDVFFTTSSQLVGQDGDHAPDIYDARVAGGFAAPAAPPAPCVSLATCRSMVATAPVHVAPASVRVAGSGNLAPVAEAQALAAPGKAKGESRSEKLAKALKACKKERSKTKRASCVAQAHKRYGPTRRAKLSASRGGRS
jgi:hypothetical protein